MEVFRIDVQPSRLAFFTKMWAIEPGTGAPPVPASCKLGEGCLYAEAYGDLKNVGRQENVSAPRCEIKALRVAVSTHIQESSSSVDNQARREVWCGVLDDARTNKKWLDCVKTAPTLECRNFGCAYSCSTRTWNRPSKPPAFLIAFTILLPRKTLVGLSRTALADSRSLLESEPYSVGLWTYFSSAAWLRFGGAPHCR